MTPEQFADAVEDFQSHIRRDPISIPDDFTLLEYINTDWRGNRAEDWEDLPATELTKLLNDAENADTVESLRMFREHYYLRRLENEPTGQTGMIFALKQQKNGGYTDKQEVSSEKKLTIHLAGVGGDEACK
jgi:hypothetical protein